MDKIIIRATNSINQLLEESSEYEDISSSQLNEIRTLLNRLLESDLSRNNWTQLFCRQVNRLMDYNQKLSENFWIGLNDDILYLLEKQNDTQGIGSMSERFLKSMDLEEKLVQRELKFQQTFGKRKHLSQLFSEHEMFFEEYLQKCIILHSKVQVQGLIKDLNGFLCDNCGLKESSSIQANRKDLYEKLNRIEISFDCSTRLLKDVYSELFEYANSNKRVNNEFGNFIPSAEPRFDRDDISETFVEAFQSERWLVILGDPGSAKTSLLRWITCVFAENAHCRIEEMILEGKTRYPVRIPILIRIGEFAVWLEQHQNKTLMDYIGKHTWFSQTYTRNDSGIVLRELIDHGHALILIDGLDEIPEIAHRKEIVDLVQKFIDEYVIGSDFVSVSDNLIFNNPSEYFYREVIEAPPPSIPGGNQALVTSRIVGYHLHPLNSPFFYHCSLSLMNHGEAKEFVKQWMTKVEKGVLQILMNEGIKIDEQIIENTSKRRENSVQAIFENSSKLLMSNPSLLSLICTFIFQSSDEIEFKSRVQVYNCAVETAFGAQKCKELNISENLLSNFLINLATYLHLQSPSGLIDAFDIEHLCYSTLRQQSSLTKRKELRETALQLITLLMSNNGIVDERGLQTFGFLHLSFQEYFVSQYFVKGSSVKQTVERILILIINPRFRESLLMSLGWIGWKWSVSDYDHFCDLLVTPTRNYAIPFGALLFFDAIDDMQRLPSKPVIFTALASLLDHPYNIIAEKYLISNLFKLPIDVITEWMQLHLKDDKRLSKFCECLQIKFNRPSDMQEINSKRIASIIYQQLTSFHNVSASSEFIIDHFFRRTIILENAPNDILTNELTSYISSHNICASDIHPLVLSVIIAVCGGICFDSEGYMIKINFSSKFLHHNSSVILPIINYFNNSKEPHSTKVQELIKQYESILEKASPSDTSVDIVDTFIALVCLKGLLEPLIYQKYDEYLALSLALTRLKRIWFYLTEPFTSVDIKYYGTIETSSILESDVESVIKAFLIQSELSVEERVAFCLACASALNKLCIRCSSNSFSFDIFLTNHASRYLGCQPELGHSTRSKQYQISKNIHHMQMFQNEPSFLLTFVPQSLQKLYHYMIIDVINETDSLPLVVFLSQCLLLLEDIDVYDLNLNLALSTLQIHFKQCMLENYALILSDEFSENELVDYNIYIDIERQRICDGKTALMNKEKDLQLFAASICLARTFRSRQNQSTKDRILSAVDSEEVRSVVMDIIDPAFRIIALSMILDMRNPLIFDEEQTDELRWEMISLLQSLLPSLPILTSTLLFIRCYTAQQAFPMPFQQMADLIGKKLNEFPIDGGSQARDAAFIALQQLNNSDLSHYLTEFIKQTTANLSDLFQFNSSVFFRYFTDATHDIGDPVLLSVMYLTELAFDAQILKMNTSDNPKDKIWPLKQWKQLWNDSSSNRKRMTFKMAKWITNYLQTPDKSEIHTIIEDMYRCLSIEKRVLPVIEKWLEYRMDKYLRFFAYYAALQLLIEGSNIPDLIDIITEIFDMDKRFCFISLVERLFQSELVDSTIYRRILIILNQKRYYFSKISVRIDRKETLELILSLELERIISNMHRSSELLTNSFLSIIDRRSHDLQPYLVEHLRKFTNEQNEVQNNSKKEYIVVLFKWIVENMILEDERGDFAQELYEYIFTFLNDKQFPQIQKAVLSDFNSLFRQSYRTSKDHVSSTGKAITYLEKIIYSYDIYSEDVIAICLLAYGNCLLQLQRFQVSYHLSNEIQDVFNKLFETSSSKIVSIRAAFCLIIAEQSSLTFDAISHWLRNKWNLTPENKYYMLLQQTLYEWNHDSFHGGLWKIVDHIKTYSAELLDKFVLELYIDLCKQGTGNYLSKSTPDYINIATKLSEKHFSVFQNAVQTSYFGEDTFKRQLYLYHAKNSQCSTAIVSFYAAFGVLTAELIEMLAWIDDDSNDGIWCYLKDIKQVSDQEVIEKLFQQLDSIAYDTRFEFLSSLLKSLVQLAQVHAVSSFEVHQQISLVFNNLSHYDSFKNSYRIYSIVDSILNLSCIERMNSDGVGSGLLNESDINDEVERVIRIQEQRSALFLRRNYFFSLLQSVSKTSN